MSVDAADDLGPGTPAVGEVIAQKYRVERVVGRGGMGVVVAARHLQLGQTVAIKLLTLPADEERRGEAVARFLNEAQAAARLRSDHVVRIYDVGQLDSGLPFMVMELLSGSDLGSLLEQRGPLPEAEVVDYVLQTCAAVAEAHELGIIHRDLKPANLFVTERSDGLPWLKVLDFGISKQLSDPNSGEVQPSLTSTRTLMGSPNYMSPEQVRDARRVDVRADIWALGIILQELLTDAPVFQGDSFPGVCAAIVADPPTPVRTLRPDVSERLVAIIARCLEKDVARRYQSVAELVKELSTLSSRGSLGSLPIVYSSPARRSTASANLSKPASRDAHSDPTLAMPSSEPEAPGGGTTLESARLRQLEHTGTALSSPDSRIVITSPKPRSSSLRRLVLPLGLGLLLAGAGSLWWRGGRATEQARPSAEPSEPSGRGRDADAASGSFTLSIESDPPGASVSEGNVRLGATPFSFTLSLPEGASPRVLVLEKEGFLPYVVRQGAARGQVKITAVLTPKPPAPIETSVAPPPDHPLRKPLKARPPAPKSPAAVSTRPASDIRLER